MNDFLVTLALIKPRGIFFFFTLIIKFGQISDSIKNTEAIIQLGNIYDKRDYIHINDLVKLFSKFNPSMHYEKGTNYYNVGSNKSIDPYSIVKMLEDILKNHNYPNRIALLLAEVTLLTALIGEMIKLRWRLSLQIRGEGPVKLLATDYFAPNKNKGVARLRAYADYDKTRDFSSQKISSDLIGKGLSTYDSDGRIFSSVAIPIFNLIKSSD